MANNDYAGQTYTMESFTAQTTNGDGDIVVVLQNTPAADDAIIVNLQGVAGAFAQVQSRSGTSLTVRCYQKYDRTDTTAGGTVTGLPASVTADTTTGGPTLTSSAPSNVQTSGANPGSPTAVPNHTHTTQVNKISDHNHTETATVLTALDSTGSIVIVVTYAF